MGTSSLAKRAARQQAGDQHRPPTQTEARVRGEEVTKVVLRVVNQWTGKVWMWR